MSFDRIADVTHKSRFWIDAADIVFEAIFFKEGPNELNAATEIAGQLGISKPLGNKERKVFMCWLLPHFPGFPIVKGWSRGVERSRLDGVGGPPAPLGRLIALTTPPCVFNPSLESDRRVRH